jgi:hypothetical protein
MSGAISTYDVSDEKGSGDGGGHESDHRDQRAQRESAQTADAVSARAAITHARAESNEQARGDQRRA